MTKILVTGGSGFIGTNVVSYYLAKGCQVLTIDTMPPKDQAHLPFFRRVDILDLELLKRTFSEFQPTHIFHLAARTDLDEKVDIKGYEANTTGVENVISALSVCQQLQRVMFTSSMYVCFPGYNPNSYSDYTPHTLYGKSKVMTENIVHASTIIRPEWVMIRPTSIWGPWFGVPYNLFFHHVKRGTYFIVKGKTANKTLGFIGNAVDQMDKLMFAPKDVVNKKTFYIGDYPGLNINDWAKEVSRQLNVKLFTLPLFVLRMGGWFGDVVGFFGIRFPLQSFRVKNMTTDNVIGLLEDTLTVTGKQHPYSISEGVRITIDWLKATDPEFQR